MEIQEFGDGRIRASLVTVAIYTWQLLKSNSKADKVSSPLTGFVPDPFL